jgi:hypothetical protein
LDESSREVASLFHAYGAVDHHVDVNLGSDPARIRRLLPIYKHPRSQWFRKFARARRLPAEELDEPHARVHRALDEFSQRKPASRLRARRLYAVAVVAQAFPDIPARKLASAALGPGELEDGPAGDARAQKLAARLRSQPARDSQSGRDAWWDALLDPWLIPDAGGIGPRPCSGSLSWVTVNGDRDLVPTLKTVFDAHLKFDDAEEFCLDPTRWECFPSWCGMTELHDPDLPNGIRRYREVVSFDCDNDAFPKLTVDLNFHCEQEDKPRRRVLTEYWLSDHQPEQDVERNQGWLEVLELSPDTVRVTTTKTVKFRDDLGGPGLASMACRVGYLSMVGDLVTCAARPEGERGYPADVSFPGRMPPEGARTAGPAYGVWISSMVDETASAYEDIADNWMGMLRGGARFADAGLRVARAPGAGGRRMKRDRGKP